MERNLTPRSDHRAILNRIHILAMSEANIWPPHQTVHSHIPQSDLCLTFERGTRRLHMVTAEKRDVFAHVTVGKIDRMRKVV